MLGPARIHAWRRPGVAGGLAGRATDASWRLQNSSKRKGVGPPALSSAVLSGKAPAVGAAGEKRAKRSSLSDMTNSPKASAAPSQRHAPPPSLPY